MLTMENASFVPRFGKKRVDKDLFLRDWLWDKHYETYNALATDEKVTIGEKGLRIESGAEEMVVRREFLEFIDWLYAEFDSYSRT